MNQTIIIKKKKIILFLLVILFLFSFVNFGLAECANDNDCPNEFKCINNECVRPLEVVYPQIGNEPSPKTVTSGLPNYIKYIFNFVVSVIGFIILGILIYNGVLYLTSVGDAQKMRNAKDGIIYAFLGGILLISSVLIFNTINPQLMIMELPKIKPLEEIIQPGIYICNYKVKEDINKIIEDYSLEGYPVNLTEDEIKTQKEAAEKLKNIIWNQNNKNQKCLKVNFSGNLQNFKITKNNTIFAIPSIKIIEDSRQAYYDYGLILHEKEDYSGKCYLINQDTNNIYQQIKSFSAGELDFNARSITLFQKPSSEPQGDGVTLYECFNYNKQGQCVDNHPTPLSNNFKPEGDDNLIKIENLQELGENTRSIVVSSNFLALLFEKDDFDGLCKIVTENKPDLTDFPLGSCKCQKSSWYTFGIWNNKQCIPCLNSMIVIKGNRL